MGRVFTASLFFVLLLSFASALTTGTGTPTPAETASTTLSCDRFHKTGFWDVDIDNWPALPPACGPPISANALRDRSKLPIQICGVVASYILFVVVVGILLITTGKRMRRTAEVSTRSLEIEMVPNKHKFEPSSPAFSQRSWLRGPLKNLRSSTLSKEANNPASPNNAPNSPGVASITSFDGKILDQQRESRQAEMERLYAAVMAHEDAKRSTGRLSNHKSTKSTSSEDGIDAVPSLPTEESKRKLRVQISETSLNGDSFNQIPPKSPYKAIYPPYSPGGDSFKTDGQSPLTPMTPRAPGLNHAKSYDHMGSLPSPTSPMSPKRIELPNDMYPASPPPRQVAMQFPSTHDGAYEHPPPPFQGSRQSSSSGSGRSRKLGLKNLRIGAPSHHDEEDREPLSPREYNPVAPPNPPAYGVRFQEGPQSARSVDTYASELLDSPKPLPMPSAQPSRRPPNLNVPLPSSPGVNKSPSSSVNTLPLRAFQNASSESMSQASNPLSPGPIKTTFLERKIEKLGRGPMTGRTPRTGVPPTPYSAYMPFTPITPVTPGLVSRKERKERIKAEGRKVLLEEDEVKDNEDMWDAGY